MNPATDVAQSRVRSVSEILFTYFPPRVPSQAVCPTASSSSIGQIRAQHLHAAARIA
jgi:hypothetical protein